MSKNLSPIVSAEKLKWERLKVIRAQIDYFSSLLICGKLSASCAAEYFQLKQREIQNYIKEVHEHKIYRIKRKKANGEIYYLWASNIEKKRRVTALKLDDLYQKLYDFYTQGVTDFSNTTLSQQFGYFLRDKADYVSGKTVKEYKAVWEKYYEGSYIAVTNIRDLKLRDYK